MNKMSMLLLGFIVYIVHLLSAGDWCKGTVLTRRLSSLVKNYVCASVVSSFFLILMSFGIEFAVKLFSALHSLILFFCSLSGGYHLS